jgi:hypothetical protein
MNYTYQVINPQDILLGIDHIQVEYYINNGGSVACIVNYTLTTATDPSQPNRTTYVFRTYIIRSNPVLCNNVNVPTNTITSVKLNIISSLGNTIVSINIADNFAIAQNYCVLIKFIVINNTIDYGIEDVIIRTYVPEEIIDYTSRPTKIASYDINGLLRNYNRRASTTPVRYTNSIADVVSNCNFVPYLTVQDRYFVINYDNDVTSEYASINLDKVKISGWTDRDIYFFEKVYADVSDPSVMITNEMGLLEPRVQNPAQSSIPFTIVHNMYPLSINRNGEIVVYNNQPKDFPYVTSLFHTANVSQIRYGREIYKPLTPYMYYRTITQIGQPTRVELLYSYLNRYYISITIIQSVKQLGYIRAQERETTSRIDIDNVTRNILLPIDYNILFYLESQWERLLGGDSMRFFVQSYQDEDVEYPVILNGNGDWNCNLVMFKRDSVNAITLNKDTDVDVHIMRWGAPMSFFAGGGLLGWGLHETDGEYRLSKYYLFSWYKILRTKRLASNTPRADDYLRYYYYYQYII